MSLLVILNANIIFVAAESDQSGPTKDYQVEDAQKWVNDNYGSIIGEIKEDGTSRAATFGALIKALQIELNVTNSPVANFGPGTAAAFDKLNLNMNRTKDGKEDNICYILNHALWVKGYNCGYKDKGLYDESTLEAVSQIKVDMGFYDMTMVSLERTALEISTIDSSIMKAIMNTDSYTIVDKTETRKLEYATRTK